MSAETITIECPDCDGLGEVSMIPRLDPQEAVEQACEACHGTGKVQAEACYDCGGALPHGCDGCCDRGWFMGHLPGRRGPVRLQCACQFKGEAWEAVAWTGAQS